MATDELFTRALLIKAALATLVLLGIAGLGVFAVIQGIVAKRPVYFAQAAAPLLISGIGLRVLGKYWLAYVRRGR